MKKSKKLLEDIEDSLRGLHYETNGESCSDWPLNDVKKYGEMRYKEGILKGLRLNGFKNR